MSCLAIRRRLIDIALHVNIQPKLSGEGLPLPSPQLSFQDGSLKRDSFDKSANGSFLFDKDVAVPAHPPSNDSFPYPDIVLSPSSVEVSSLLHRSSSETLPSMNFSQDEDEESSIFEPTGSSTPKSSHGPVNTSQLLKISSTILDSIAEAATPRSIREEQSGELALGSPIAQPVFVKKRTRSSLPRPTGSGNSTPFAIDVPKRESSLLRKRDSVKNLSGGTRNNSPFMPTLAHSSMEGTPKVR